MPLFLIPWLLGGAGVSYAWFKADDWRDGIIKWVVLGALFFAGIKILIKRFS